MAVICEYCGEDCCCHKVKLNVIVKLSRKKTLLLSKRNQSYWDHDLLQVLWQNKAFIFTVKSFIMKQIIFNLPCPNSVIVVGGWLVVRFHAGIIVQCTVFSSYWNKECQVRR